METCGGKTCFQKGITVELRWDDENNIVFQVLKQELKTDNQNILVPIETACETFRDGLNGFTDDYLSEGRY